LGKHGFRRSSKPWRWSPNASPVGVAPAATRLLASAANSAATPKPRGLPFSTWKAADPCEFPEPPDDCPRSSSPVDAHARSSVSLVRPTDGPAASSLSNGHCCSCRRAECQSPNAPSFPARVVAKLCCADFFTRILPARRLCSRSRSSVAFLPATPTKLCLQTSSARTGATTGTRGGAE